MDAAVTKRDIYVCIYTCMYSAVRHINKDAAVTCRFVWMTHYRPICMGAKVTDQTADAAQKIYKDIACTYIEATL